MNTTYIIIAIVIIIIAIFVVMYNKIISLKNAIANAFSDMDVQMKMRVDLVDNLVNTVKGYTGHEKSTLEELTKARTQWMSATALDEKAKADASLTGALKTLFATSENYPELKANTNFLQLQTELSDIENQIAGSRRYYNATIKEYNNAVMTFPNNIVAGVFGYKNETSYFTITESEKQAPKVQF
ncbi:MAG: LemA family protein [candidate division SR1 bacterium]|nr:LemA family protein [candidate division SR1 bacterium]